MPELSALLANKRWVEAEFNDIVFKVAYRPGSMSLMAQADLQGKIMSLQNNQEIGLHEQMVKLGEIFCDVVCDWDLTDNGRPVPITVEAVTSILPGAAIVDALNAVTNDGNTGKEEKKVQSVRSGAGLPVAVRQAVAPNGIPLSEEPGTWA